MEHYCDLPAGAPPRLKWLVARLQECAEDRPADLCWYLRESFEYMQIYFASVALSTLALAGELDDSFVSRLRQRCAENRWPNSLPLALSQMRLQTGNHPIAADLLAVFEGSNQHSWLVADEAGRTPFEDWRHKVFGAGLPQPQTLAAAAAELAPVLKAWLDSAATFFALWAEGLEPSPWLGHLQLFLNQGGKRLQLFPFLDVQDCQDCGALGEMFAYAGAGSRGQAIYRNLRLGHTSSETPKAPVDGWLAISPDAGAPIDIDSVLKPFSEDALKLLPEAFLAPVRRQIGDGVHGYFLIEGESGAGKTYLCRFIETDPQILERSCVLYYPVRHHLVSSLWLIRFDDYLRREYSACYRFPAREVVWEILRKQAGQGNCLADYLSLLGRVNNKPVLLLLDGFGREPQNARMSEHLPGELPKSVALVLTCEPGALEQPGSGLNEITNRIRLTIRLSPGSAPYADLVSRFLAQQKDYHGPPTGRSFYDSGLWLQGRDVDGRTLPPEANFIQEVMNGLAGRFGSELGRRDIEILQLLAAAGEPLPVSWLADWLGSRGELEAWAARCSGLLRTCHTSLQEIALELAQQAVVSFLWQAYPEPCHLQCRRLAHWAAQQVRVDSALPGDVEMGRAVRGLFPWLMASADDEFILRLSRSNEVTAALQARVTEFLHAGDQATAGTLTEAWRTCLRMAGDHGAGQLDFQVATVAVLRGEVLGCLGAGEAARAEYRSAIDLLRDGSTSRALLARAYIQRGALQGGEEGTSLEDCCAGQELLGALEEDNFTRALACRTLGRLTGTLELLERAATLYGVLGRQDDLSATCREAGDLATDLGDLGAAATHYSRAIQSVPEGGPTTSSAERARAMIARALVKAEQGDAPGATQDLVGAARLLDRLVRQDLRLDLSHELALCHYSLGSLYSDQGNDNQAESDYDLAIDLFDALLEEDRSEVIPSLAQALAERGLARRRRGDPAALQDYDRAVYYLSGLVEGSRRYNLRSQLARTYNNRGEIRAWLLDSQGALADYDRAVANFTTLLDQQGMLEFRYSLGMCYYNRGNAYRRGGRSVPAAADLDKAVTLLKLARDEGQPEISRDVATALLSRGMVYHVLDRTAEALQDCSVAIQILSDLPFQESGAELATAHGNRAGILADQGDSALALAEYDRALSACQGGAEVLKARVHLNLAQTFFDTGQLEEAALELDASLSRKVDLESVEQAGAYVLLAEVSGQLGDLPRALALYPLGINLYLEVGAAGKPAADAYAALSRVKHGLRDLDGAVGDIRAALELYAGLNSSEGLAQVRADAHNHASQLLFEQGHYQPALRETDRVLELCASSSDPRRAEAFFWRGRALESLGLREQALREYSEAVQGYFDLVDNRKQYPLMVPLVKAYLGRARVDPAPADALQDYDWAITILCDLMERQHRSDLASLLAQGYFHRAEAYWSLGRTQEAEHDIRKGVDLIGASPGDLPQDQLEDFCQACVRLGAIRAVEKDFAGARGHLVQAVQHLPEHTTGGRRVLVGALRECALVSEQMGEFSLAFEERTRALQLMQQGGEQLCETPVLAMEFCLHGDLFVRRGEPGEAIRSFEKCVELCDQIADVQVQGRLLVLAGARLGRALGLLGEIERALQAYSTALDYSDNPFVRQGILGETLEVYNNRGQTYSFIGDSERAIADFSRALELCPPTVDRQHQRVLALILNNLGTALTDTGDLETGLQHFSRAIDIYTRVEDDGGRSDLALAHNNRGQTLSDLGRLDDAVTDFTTAITLYTSIIEEPGGTDFRGLLATAYFNRACALDARDQAAEALQDLKQCVNICRVLVSGDGQLEHREMLAESYVCRAGILERLGQKAEALEDYERAAGIYTVLVGANEGGSEFSERLKACTHAMQVGFSNA